MQKRSVEVIFWLLIGCAVLLAGCVAPGGPTGALAGQVSIGPLSPVVREGESEPTPAPEVFAERQVVIYRASGRSEVARAPIGPDGSYRVDLPAGRYVVDINHLGMDQAKGLPAPVDIVAGQTTRLDIAIDTGIR